MGTSKKSFKSNPAMAYITAPEATEAPKEPEREDSPSKAKEAPKWASEPLTDIPEKAPDGYRVNPLFIEKKTRRMQILLQPSTAEAIKSIAQNNGISTNDLINKVLREYVRTQKEIADNE